jgi:thiol-disulfide isomerase/thioredoxin
MQMENIQNPIVNNQLLQRRRLLTYLGMGASTFSIASLFDLKYTTVVNASPSSKILPEFDGIVRWLNSPSLTARSLTGKVVLVHFWTFACINCQRTLPYVTKWSQKYADKGLDVIGIHTPEFIFERNSNNVQQALTKHKINYPVAMDNDYKTWNAYQNEYWPRLYLADRQGIIQYDLIGEGAYDETEQNINQLLDL